VTPTQVLLVTYAVLPGGEVGGELLVKALGARNIAATWVSWDDPSVDWAAADAVAVRSTWDYHRRCAEFLAWARATEQVTRLLNGGEVFAWNADKVYLTELTADVDVVPTELLDDGNLVTGLQAALDRWGTVVVKPRTGAGGGGVVIAGSTHDERLEGLTAAPWVVQPLVESVRTTGETSVYVFGGRAVSQVDKIAAGGEIRVHDLYGGSSRPVDVGAEQGALAEAAVRAAATRHGTELAYARVDMMVWDDRWVVSELELIEPGLYLDVAPEVAGPFADLLARRLQHHS
jgi:glutathione synthase/RimK-type ligase-like ATP-grasp enzyme